MNAHHTPAANPYRDFAAKTLREAPEKLPAALQALTVYYVVPLFLHLDLLLSVALLVPVLGCTIVFLTQPKFSLQQLTIPEDGRSMKYLLGATVLSQMVTVTEWAYFTRNHPYSWTVASGIGLALIVGGLIVRVWAIVELGAYFDNRVHIQKNHQLIETGPYRYVRHGSYTGVYMLALGIAVYLSAWLGLVVSALVLGWAYRYRIIKEEQTLIDHFGDDYRAYMRKTRMLIPFIL